jgi:hypothetical protein
MAHAAAETLDLLIEERPSLHQSATGQNINYAINDRVLVWLADNLRPGQRTLETGCGYSTIMFTSVGTQHTAIAPAQAEFDRIAQWCAANGISTAATTFIVRPSESVLPTLELPELDVVLIDGQHSFPYPMLDWFYTAQRLKVDGQLILDDIHMRAVYVLYDFLTREAGRWELETRRSNTAVFRKLVIDPLNDISWREQPWGARPIMTPGRWFKRIAYAPTARIIKKSRLLTSWLRPLYREHFVKRRG